MKCVDILLMLRVVISSPTEGGGIDKEVVGELEKTVYHSRMEPKVRLISFHFFFPLGRFYTESPEYFRSLDSQYQKHFCYIFAHHVKSNHLARHSVPSLIHIES